MCEGSAIGSYTILTLKILYDGYQNIYLSSLCFKLTFYLHQFRNITKKILLFIVHLLFKYLKRVIKRKKLFSFKISFTLSGKLTSANIYYSPLLTNEMKWQFLKVAIRQKLLKRNEFSTEQYALLFLFSDISINLISNNLKINLNTGVSKQKLSYSTHRYVSNQTNIYMKNMYVVGSFITPCFPKEIR